MKKWYSLSLTIVACTLLCLASSAFAQTQSPLSTQSPTTGIVNFKLCVEESKLGKAEQAAFESLKNQMAAVLEKTEKELDDVAAKLSDPEQVDALSAKAEEELKEKFQRLSQDLNRFQNQYYQILNQANFKVLNTLSTKVADAAETVARSRNLNLVLNEEACFFYSKELDITKLVVAEMDKNYVPESNLNAPSPSQAPSQAPSVNPPSVPAQPKNQPKR